MVICFALDDRRSFERVINWLEELKKHANEDIIMFLVGNKNDVAERVISKEEAQQLADLHKLEYFEASAKTGNQVNHLFNEMGSLLLDNAR